MHRIDTIPHEQLRSGLQVEITIFQRSNIRSETIPNRKHWTWSKQFGTTTNSK